MPVFVCVCVYIYIYIYIIYIYEHARTHTHTHTFNIPFPAPRADASFPLVEAAQTWSKVQGGNRTSSSATNWESEDTSAPRW